MKRQHNTVLSFLLLVTWMLAPAAALAADAGPAEPTRFSVKGKANIKCECTGRATASTGCPPWERVNDDQIYAWHVMIYIKPDLELDLVDLCYRKRDDGAQTLCCDAEPPARPKLYRGSVYAIEEEKAAPPAD